MDAMSEVNKSITLRKLTCRGQPLSAIITMTTTGILECNLVDSVTS